MTPPSDTRSLPLDAIAHRLAPLGLQILGHCPTTADDNLPTGTLALIGPKEPDFWPIFLATAEVSDGAPNPLDRWSERVLCDIANETGTTALFPFGGPPFLPFYTWALRSGRFWPAPIHFLVHDTVGLFASFRGALLLPDVIAATPQNPPCQDCANKPCTTACPVGAFTDTYNVQTCKTHVASDAGRDCLSQGCRARLACPVGQGNRLPAQAAFHMKAFL